MCSKVKKLKKQKHSYDMIYAIPNFEFPFEWNEWHGSEDISILKERPDITAYIELSTSGGLPDGQESWISRTDSKQTSIYLIIKSKKDKPFKLRIKYRIGLLNKDENEEIMSTTIDAIFDRENYVSGGITVMKDHFYAETNDYEKFFLRIIEASLIGEKKGSDDVLSKIESFMPKKVLAAFEKAFITHKNLKSFKSSDDTACSSKADDIPTLLPNEDHHQLHSVVMNVSRSFAAYSWVHHDRSEEFALSDARTDLVGLLEISAAGKFDPACIIVHTSRNFYFSCNPNLEESNFFSKELMTVNLIAKSKQNKNFKINVKYTIELKNKKNGQKILTTAFDEEFNENKNVGGAMFLKKSFDIEYYDIVLNILQLSLRD